MKPSILESFQLELREIIITAQRVKNLRLSEPIYGPVMMAADLVIALAPLDSQFQKAIDHLWQETEQTANAQSRFEGL